jgi:type III restriction enzyme
MKVKRYVKLTLLSKEGRTQGLQFENDLGYGNHLQLVDEEILENVKRIQLHNSLKQSTKLSIRDFTVEMETRTGKAYVYLRSLFELNKLYGFTKFSIVVPSIAIKEGV